MLDFELFMKVLSGPMVYTVLMGEKLIMVSGDLNPGRSNEPGMWPDKECLGAQKGGEHEGGPPHLSRW